MSHVSPALYRTLARIVPDLYVHCLEPWCLIGSAAALLVGAEVAVADVDVLVSRDDAARLTTLWATWRDPGYIPIDAQRFRSHFARFQFPGMPVEVMGDLECHGAAGWQPVQVAQMMLIGVHGMAVPVPPIAEQIRILESFGREKDQRRARQLALHALRLQP